MYTIRESNHSDQDYAAIVSTYNADRPDEQITIEVLKHYESNRNRDFLEQHFMVEQVEASDESAAVVAIIRIWESQGSYVPGKYRLELYLRPEFVDLRLQEECYQCALEFLSKQTPAPTILDTSMREDRTARVNFWTERGFEITMREPKSELVVTDYDFSRFDNAFDKIARNGIEIFTMSELRQRDPDWLQRYYDLHWVIVNDVPSTDKRTRIPVEEWGKWMDSPNILPEANFFALDGDQWVGVSNLWKDDANLENLNVGVTGVLPSHRRKGIATALKLKTFQYAIDYGAVTLKTANEESNPMYDLNLMLGFEPKPAWLSLRKTL